MKKQYEILKVHDDEYVVSSFLDGDGSICCVTNYGRLYYWHNQHGWEQH